MSEGFNPTEWLTTKEAADITGYTDRHIRQSLNNGNIPGRKKGKMWFVRMDDAIAYREKMKRMGSDKHVPVVYRKN